MNLQPEYIRDLHSHYMVLKGNREENTYYSAKMLMSNSIEGLLQTELRYMDSLDLYYYNITAKRTVKTIYESKSLDCAMTHMLIKGILQVIENSGEYLLEEHDFIINTEFIYLDEKDKLFLCYLPGYAHNIIEQLSELFEYIMNKIDYKDEAAVRLIYALYKESRDKESTFYKLYEVMEYKHSSKEGNKKSTNENKLEGSNEIVYEKDKKPSADTKADTMIGTNNRDQNNKNNNSINVVNRTNRSKNQRKIKNQQDNNIISIIKYKLKKQNDDDTVKRKDHEIKSMKINNKVIPHNYHIKKEVDKKEIVNEREVLYFGTACYVIAGSSIMIGIIALIILYFSGVVNNSFGTGVNPVNYFACVLVVLCVEIYVLFNIFDPNKKLTKMETILEYINEEDNGFYNNTSGGDSSVILQNAKDSNSESNNERTQVLWNSNGEIQEEETQVLCYLGTRKSYYLTPITTKSRVTDKLIQVKIVDFPFYIGKNPTTSNMVIEDKSISRRHGVITSMDDKFLYTDLDSTNGTFINGVKLEGNKAYPLNTYDEISFAHIKYILEELE